MTIVKVEIITAVHHVPVPLGPIGFGSSLHTNVPTDRFLHSNEEGIVKVMNPEEGDVILRSGGSGFMHGKVFRDNDWHDWNYSSGIDEVCVGPPYGITRIVFLDKSDIAIYPGEQRIACDLLAGKISREGFEIARLKTENAKLQEKLRVLRSHIESS